MRNEKAARRVSDEAARDENPPACESLNESPARSKSKPVAERTLHELERGSNASVVLVKKTWPDGDVSFLLACVRRKPAGGWYTRRSITLYAHELEEIGRALLEATRAPFVADSEGCSPPPFPARRGAL